MDTKARIGRWASAVTVLFQVFAITAAVYGKSLSGRLPSGFSVALDYLLQRRPCIKCKLRRAGATLCALFPLLVSCALNRA